MIDLAIDKAVLAGDLDSLRMLRRQYPQKEYQRIDLAIECILVQAALKGSWRAREALRLEYGYDTSSDRAIALAETVRH